MNGYRVSVGNWKLTLSLKEEYSKESMHKNPYEGRNTLIEQSAIAPTTLTKH